MTKKLKSLTYKSKTDFVTDLNLIWDNCLKYNQDMNHPLRRMANGMRKEAEKLIPLIPDLVIRPRAEVEAEERRKQNGGEDDGGEDSDDEPIMSSRGRGAASKGLNKTRKSQANKKEGTPIIDQKPLLNGLLGKQGREGSEVDGSNGFGTPLGGSATPSGINGVGGVGSGADAMDLDGPSLNEMALGEALGEVAAQVYEDEEYKIWKQVTKKDRALVAKERSALFKDNTLNVDAPALLRSRAAMRRFVKGQKQAERQAVAKDPQADPSAQEESEPQANETLAEEMEGEEVKVIPDYYEPVSLVPGVVPSLRWTEDGEGQVINHHDWSLSVVPPEHFRSPQSTFTKKMESNIRQIQETRRLSTKIAVIRQMQIQSQVGIPIRQLVKIGTRPLTRFKNRSTRTSFQDPTTIRSSKRMSISILFRIRDLLWRGRRAKTPSSALSARFYTMLALKNYSRLPLTRSPTQRRIISKS